MQPRVFPVFSIYLLLFPLFAENLCPKCHYKNEDSDRYCLNCQYEFHPLSEAEKKSLNTLNLERAKKTLNTLQSEAQKQKERKRDERQEVLPPPAPLSRFLEEIPLSIDRKIVKLGMKKQKIKNMLDLHKSLGDDIWDISSGKGLQYSTLYFAEDVLVKWEKYVYFDYCIQRNYPLNPQVLKIGMSEQEVKSLWGNPDYKCERCSYSDYSLKESYYLKEPQSATHYDQMRDNKVQFQNRFIKQGPLAEITYDPQKKILNINEREGELREGNSSEMEMDF